MPLQDGFFAREKACFSPLQAAKLFFFPSCLLLGEAVLLLVNQSMMLAAVPPLSMLLMLSAISACLVTPIFFALRFLIDKYLTQNTPVHQISNTLVYILDIFLNVQCIAMLAAVLHNPVMNIYTLYIVMGVGVLPTVALCLAVVLIMQSCSNYGRYKVETQEGTTVRYEVNTDSHGTSHIPDNSNTETDADDFIFSCVRSCF